MLRTQLLEAEQNADEMAEFLQCIYAALNVEQRGELEELAKRTGNWL